MSDGPETSTAQPLDDTILELLRDAERVSVLTGAGVSAESGIPTFRGADGIWAKYDYRRLATTAGFAEDPGLVWEWYQLRQREIMKARPNRAHEIISLMERFYPEFTVITQNIDGLHHRAGNSSVLELHGNIWRMRCDRDRTILNLSAPVDTIPPICQCGSILRPDVVWFGETLPTEILEAASGVASECEVMFVVGTSAMVYPAAALPILTKNSGGCVIEVNLEPTDVTTYADTSLRGRAGDVLPEIWTAVTEPESFIK